MVGYSSTVGFVSSVQAEKVTPVRDSACFITREHSSSPTAAGQVHPRAIHHTHRNWARVWMYIQWQTCVFERGTLISAVFFMRWGNVSLYCNMYRWDDLTDAVFSVQHDFTSSQSELLRLSLYFILLYSSAPGGVEVFCGETSVLSCFHCGSLVLDSVPGGFQSAAGERAFISVRLINLHIIRTDQASIKLFQGFCKRLC